MLISFNEVTFSYGERDIIKNITFNINEGDKVGIIGVNGAGKSTLLKLIIGEIEDFYGQININKKVKIGYLKQKLDYDENDTIYTMSRKVFMFLDEIEEKLVNLNKSIESDSDSKKITEYSQLQNFFEQQGGYNIDYKIDLVLGGMGFSKGSYGKKISTLSGGEKTRFSLGLLMLQNPDVLILDEPTNHLDFTMLIWLEKFLVEYKGAIILVSHDRYFLDRVVNNIFEVENQKINIYKGNYTKYISLKDEYIKRQTLLFYEQQKEVSKLNEYVEKNLARASTTKMAQSRRNTLEKMEMIENPQIYIKKSAIKFKSTVNPYKDVLKVENLTVSIPKGVEVTDILTGLNFSIEKGDKVAIVGDNGCGKTTFLKILMGLHNKTVGKFTFGKNTLLGYFDQEQSMLDFNLTVYEQVRKVFPSLTDLEIRNYLARLLFTKEDVFKKISMLSGGEKSKLSFCILMLQTTNVLILDEPTNHLDVFTREVLDEALKNYSGTLLFVSHDRYLLSNVCNKIIEFNKVTGSQIFVSFDDYMKYLNGKIKSKKVDKVNINDVEGKNKNYKNKDDKKERALKRQRISHLEKVIDTLESEIKLLEEEITQHIVYTDFKVLGEKTALIDTKKGELDLITIEYFDYMYDEGL